MKFVIYFFMVFFISCGAREVSDIEVRMLDAEEIDSIIDLSDSVTVEETAGAEYARIETYYRDGQDISTRMLKDAAGNIRAVILMKNGKYLHSSRYFENGQLKGSLSYSSPGVLDGPATYYYEDGRIRTKGAFKKNNRYGQWKNYDENGYLTSIELYDDDGNLLESE